MTIRRYSTLQIALHWSVAVLIAANWFLGEGMGKLLDARQSGEASGFVVHVWLGVAVLVLVLVRVVVRTVAGAPPLAESTPPLLATAATWGHRLLYLLMLGVPVGGMAAWFGGVEIAAEGHELGATLLIVVAAAHVAAALFHQVVLKDGLIARMMPGR